MSRLQQKNRQCSPVDCRPFTDKVSPMGKINPFSKIIVTLEPVMRFACPPRFKIMTKGWPQLKILVVFTTKA